MEAYNRASDDTNANIAAFCPDGNSNVAVPLSICSWKKKVPTAKLFINKSPADAVEHMINENNEGNSINPTNLVQYQRIQNGIIGFISEENRKVQSFPESDAEKGLNVPVKDSMYKLMSSDKMPAVPGSKLTNYCILHDDRICCHAKNIKNYFEVVRKLLNVLKTGVKMGYGYTATDYGRGIKNLARWIAEERNEVVESWKEAYPSFRKDINDANAKKKLSEPLSQSFYLAGEFSYPVVSSDASYFEEEWMVTQTFINMEKWEKANKRVKGSCLNHNL